MFRNYVPFFVLLSFISVGPAFCDKYLLKDPILMKIESALESKPGHPLIEWCKKVWLDIKQPKWKREMASRAADGHAKKFGAKLTFYQPNRPDNHPHHDAALGGGPYPAWSLNRMLRDGDCAASKAHPFGQVIFLSNTKGSVVVVDRGGAVKSYSHLDICAVRPKDYLRRARTQAGSSQAWILGHGQRSYFK